MHLYDVLTDSTIKELFRLSQKWLKRSLVVNENDAGEPMEEVSKVRTSVEGVIPKRLPELTKLIEAITGLSVARPSSAEYYAVASYVLGGHYECHVDAVRP